MVDRRLETHGTVYVRSQCSKCGKFASFALPQHVSDAWERDSNRKVDVLAQALHSPRSVALFTQEHIEVLGRAAAVLSANYTADALLGAEVMAVTVEIRKLVPRGN